MGVASASLHFSKCPRNFKRCPLKMLKSRASHVPKQAQPPPEHDYPVGQTNLIGFLNLFFRFLLYKNIKLQLSSESHMTKYSHSSSILPSFQQRHLFCIINQPDFPSSTSFNPTVIWKSDNIKVETLLYFILRLRNAVVFSNMHVYGNKDLPK